MAISFGPWVVAATLFESIPSNKEASGMVNAGSPMCLRLGLGGPGHGPVFGTPFGPSLGLGLGPVSVHLGHGPVRS